MKIILIFLLICCINHTYAATDLDGCYLSSPDDVFIQISHDTLWVKLPSSNADDSTEKILAKCLMKEIDQNFLEINSIESPFDILSQAEQVIYLNTIRKNHGAENDSIAISFDFPYQGEIEIHIYPNMFGSITFLWSPNHKTIVLPKMDSFGYDLYNPLCELQVNEMSKNCVIFSFDAPIQPKGDDIQINQPAFDESLARLYDIRGEYLIVLEDGIMWNGKKYKKQ